MQAGCSLGTTSCAGSRRCPCQVGQATGPEAAQVGLKRALTSSPYPLFIIIANQRFGSPPGDRAWRRRACCSRGSWRLALGALATLQLGSKVGCLLHTTRTAQRKDTSKFEPTEIGDWSPLQHPWQTSHRTRILP